METPESLTKISIWEAMTEFNQRTALGRVVVNPPGRMAPLKPHPTGEEWFLCKKCGFACQTQEKMQIHREKHLQDESSDEDDDEVDTRIVNTSDSDDDLPLEFIGDIINKKKDHFQCGICHKRLVSLKGLSNHHIVHQEKRRAKCKICGASFKKKQYLLRHEQRSHNPAFRFSCKFCPCRCETERGLQSHVIFYHDANSVEVAPTKKKEPIKIMTDPKPERKSAFLKTASPARFNESTKFKFSVPTKYTIQARTDRSIVLKAIQQNSKAIKRVECHICEKVFGSTTGLRYHMYGHTGERPHPCKICGAAFRIGAALRKHIERTHGDGAYKCRYCPCRLASPWVRLQHCYRYHPNRVKSSKINKMEQQETFSDQIRADELNFTEKEKTDENSCESFLPDTNSP